MMNYKLRQAVRMALATGALAATVATPAFAQAPGEEASQLDRVQVTGTRISRSEIETAQPVTVITREDINLSGKLTVADLLQQSPFNTFGSFRETSGFASGASGTNAVSLRGLGSNRTLVLLDGRRISTTASSAGSTQDLNLIPLNAIERIEILRDGASAVYGSDAIAGVINLISRKDYEGVTFEIQASDPTNGGKDAYAAVSGGVSSGSGRVFYTVSHYDRAAQYYRDLDYAFPATDHFGITSWGFPATFIHPQGNFVDPRCPVRQGDSTEFPNSYTWDLDTTSVSGDGAFGRTRCGYDFSADIKSMPTTKRSSVFVRTEYDISSNLMFDGRFLMNQNESKSRFAGAPVTAPFPTMSADNPNNPSVLYGLDPANVTLLFRSVPFGTRNTEVQYNNYDATLGLVGNNSWFNHSFEWRTYGQYNRFRADDSSYNLVNKETLQKNINDGRLDIFEVNGPLDLGALAEARHTGLYQSETTRTAGDASVSFDYGSLAGGDIAWAFGTEYADIAFNQQNDPQSNRFVIAGSAGGDNFAASRYVTSAFFETLLPVLPTVDVTIAGRYDDYSDSGVSGQFSPAGGIAWRPLDRLLFRASYGEGFRVAGLDELYGNINESFPSGTDLVGCANGVAPCTPTQYRSFFGANPDLGPEESKSWTVGAVWEPIDRLELEVSYYFTEFDGLITTSSLNREFRAEADGFANTVTRNPDGTVDFISLQTQNFEGVETDGIDFRVGYTLNTDGLGLFRLGLEGIKVLSYKQRVFEGDPWDRLEGEIGQPDLRLLGSVYWDYGDWGVAVIGNFIDSQTSTSGGEKYEVSSYFQTDLQVRYALPWNADIVGGVLNAFDRDPPTNSEWFGWEPFDFTLYNTFGRTPYLRYRQSF